ncbi:hypothetical protein ACJIZ3_013727 [Penstemon smallii]|uniref:Uncharacterized protein n=1 Tax=Penstemon smallii TaxID=265156 RepID=A0ABD3RI98_9LAMI
MYLVFTLSTLRQLNLNFSNFICSSVNRMSEARHLELPSMNHYLRSYSMPVFPVKSPMVSLRRVSSVSMPPLGARSYARGLVSGENVGERPFKRPRRINRPVNPSQEIIVISDDEEDELDLTLKL